MVGNGISRRKDPTPQWQWGRLEIMIGPTPLRYHVWVSVKDRQKIFDHLVLKNTTKPLSLAEGGVTWVPLCAFLRALRFERSDRSTSNKLIIKAPVQHSSRCDVCVSRASRTLWKSCD